MVRRAAASANMAARLYKRGRIWWTWFYDADGRRRVKSTRCRDHRAASIVARQLERESAAPGNAASAETIRGACERLRVDRENRGRSDATISYYETKLGHILRVFGADTLLSEVDPVSVDAYIATRRSEDASIATIAKELGALRGALRLAARRGEYDRDPSSVLPEGWSGGYRPRTRSLTEDQARELIAELRHDRAAHVAFMLATGARLGESIRARRSDIDLDRHVVALRGTKTPGARRIVPVLAHVADLAARAVSGAAKAGPAYAPWPNVRRDIAAACRRAQVPVVSPNDLRRSAATWLIERGAPAHLVAYYLGHVGSRMVERVYGRVDGEALARAFAAAADL